MKRTQLRKAVAAWAPSLWVRWRLIRRPRSAERELSLLKNVVGPNDVAVDVGANFGLYTRTLARLSASVHAFEPSPAMADTLRRSSAHNVTVHEAALSDGNGRAALRIPRAGDELSHSRASLEAGVAAAEDVTIADVARRRLDAVIEEPVSFVKVDVEGHELSVLHGARGLIERCRPIFLVEAEDRHRDNATASVFDFFRRAGYEGFFLRGDEVVSVNKFDAGVDQDVSALQENGGRADGRYYINNFFFFPAERDGRAILAA